MDQKKKGGSIKIIIIAIIIVAIIGGGFYAYSSGLLGGSEGGEVNTISEATLKEVVAISELSTVSYTYNAIALVYAEDGKTLKYHVAYKGTVKAGIDFEEISITVDDDSKLINIKIPDVKILDCEVDAGTLDYIFEKDKYNIPTVSSEAYKICLEDLKTKARQEKDLKTLAQDNAVSAVKGLIEPWVKQIDGEYTVEVN